MSIIKDKFIIAGNWKMNKTLGELRIFIEKIVPKISDLQCEIMIFTPYLGFKDALEISKSHNLKIGAQNFHFESCGPYTGEISAEMLLDVGINMSLVGHSERRKFFGETNESVNKKIKKAITLNMSVILCVGESLEEREGNKYKKTVEVQIKEALNDISYESLENITIAYEPVWAIGTGKTASPKQSNEMCLFIKQCVRSIYNLGEKLIPKVLYGGSITPENCKEIFSMSDIDGGLVGGASLDESKFFKIAKIADDIIKGDM